MKDTDFENTPSITFANGRGDITITWTEENKEFVKELIEKKLKNGYSFFVIVPRKVFGTERPAVKTTLTQKNLSKYIDTVSRAVQIEEMDDYTVEYNLPDYKSDSSKVISVNQDGLEIAFNVDDKDIEAHLLKNEVTLVRKGKLRASFKDRQMKRSTDVEELSHEKSIAIRPIVGG
jgi:hypothetical protein